MLADAASLAQRTTGSTKIVSLEDPVERKVGEVRDARVAQILGQAAGTGHLVLSSMHTSDAATAITGLTNLGLEAHRWLRALPACSRSG